MLSLGETEGLIASKPYPLYYFFAVEISHYTFVTFTHQLANGETGSLTFSNGCKQQNHVYSERRALVKGLGIELALKARLRSTARLGPNEHV